MVEWLLMSGSTRHSTPHGGVVYMSGSETIDSLCIVLTQCGHIRPFWYQHLDRCTLATAHFFTSTDDVEIWTIELSGYVVIDDYEEGQFSSSWEEEMDITLYLLRNTQTDEIKLFDFEDWLESNLPSL